MTQTISPTSTHLFFGRRLEACFEQMEQLPLTVVTAPVGSGKTTAVQEYLRRSGRPFCLLRGENTGEQVAARLASQLGEPFPAGLDPAEAAALLLERVSEPLVLVAEDYHGVTPWLDRFFQELMLLISRLLADGQPVSLSLILVGRERVPWAAEWFLSGCCCAVSLAELSLPADELGAFFLRQGISLSEEEESQLFQWTEGWLPALYACVNQYRREGSLRLPVDFLLWMAQAVWEPMAPAERQVLLHLCHFPSFTMAEAGDFLQALLPGEDLSAVLAALSHRCLFLTTEPEGALYRPHPVFRRCVRRQFDCLPGEQRRRILSRAGRAMLAREEWDEAALLLCEGENWLSLSHLLTGRGLSRLSAPVMDRMLTVLRHSSGAALPPQGDWMLGLLRQVWNNSFGLLPLGSRRGGMAGLRYFLRRTAAEAPDLLPQVVQLLLSWSAPMLLLHFAAEGENLAQELDALQDLSAELPFDGLLDCMVLQMRGEVALLQGDLTKARFCARSVVMAAPGQSQWGGYLSGILLLSLTASLQREQTEDWMAQAMERLERHRVGSLLPVARLAQACLLEHRAQLPGEEALLSPPQRTFFTMLKLTRLSRAENPSALTYGECLMAGNISLPLKIGCCAACSAAASRLKDSERMLQYLRQGLTLARTERLWLPLTAPVVRPLLSQLDDPTVDQVLYLAGQLKHQESGSPTALTEREREVALLAARGFSNKEISERLFLSDNTVKSRLKVVFDKLDIHSRRELRRIFGLES